MTSAIGVGKLAVPSITFPLGISFFTFHGISYVVDVYRGVAQPMRSLANYGQYMAFFPQLIAGPIVRYTRSTIRFALHHLVPSGWPTSPRASPASRSA